jgi:hypothetical protein
LSVDFLLAPFTALAVWAIVRIRHVPGNVFSPGRSLLPVQVNKAKGGLSLAPGTLLHCFFAIPFSDRDVSFASHISDQVVLPLRSLRNTGKHSQSAPSDWVFLSTTTVMTAVEMGSNLLNSAQKRSNRQGNGFALQPFTS